jgi:hypothetical protein
MTPSPYLRRIQTALAERGVRAPVPTGTDPHPDAVGVVERYASSLYHRRLEELGFGDYALEAARLRTMLQSVDTTEAVAALHVLDCAEHAEAVLARADISLAARLVALMDPPGYVEHLRALYRELDGLTE